MKSKDIRNNFLDFFESKKHKIVSSAPMVIKDDPTLMFTNAGMNQFKDVFLGNSSLKYSRIADTQKCLRVSGKHNDLEEVGHDTYHHTMFEMLGNWSFGDYFKKEAIEWAWELLTDRLGLAPQNLYVTVFEGDKKDGTEADTEALGFWKSIVPENQILFGNKKDNFWEMGETGPCGPCSEIHVDLRSEEDKKKLPGTGLVNKDHPLVIEIWNLVFIQYNRLTSGELQALPSKHIDTGMGFERLCMALQGKTSNYDTDVFQPLIKKLETRSGFEYGKDPEKDIAMRVCSDHVRAVAFAIADGQLPSNTGAGYVIRRILRRAVRYGFTFLDFKEPFLFELVPVLVDQMSYVFKELGTQKTIIEKVVAEEEASFLRTLEQGLKLFDQYTGTESNKTKQLIAKFDAGNDIQQKIVNGAFAFELFDTFGFPIDLTKLIAKEKGWLVDMDGFNKGLAQQKTRSRQAAVVDAEDWVVLDELAGETKFLGYDQLSAEVKIVKYRKVTAKKKTQFEVVLDQTPFYAESGGQVGDMGHLELNDKKFLVLDTKKVNNLSVHICPELPEDSGQVFIAVVDAEKRTAIANNHTATHLLHSALRIVLGEHVEQKGSLVDPGHLRFDFSHFSKLTNEEIRKVEQLVNARIRQNIAIEEHRSMPIKDAQAMGAMALFGEKYGDQVRVISFDRDYSVELCGGTHVMATGQIGSFKIVSEAGIAAGIRRIEAITAKATEDYYFAQLDTLDALQETLKISKDVLIGAQKLMEEHANLQKELNKFQKEKTVSLQKELAQAKTEINGINFIAAKIDADINVARDLAFGLSKVVENMFLILGASDAGKANLSIMISENLVKERNLNAGKMIREIAKEIKGGGGGQAHFATAGGKNPAGIQSAFEVARSIISSL
jgi:alanyl-tRNA synthetase